MDPYAGITFGQGETDHTSGVWNFLDMGMGPWGGIAVYGGMALGHWKLQGVDSVSGMVRGAGRAAYAGATPMGIDKNWWNTLRKGRAIPGATPVPTALERGFLNPGAKRFVNLSDDVRAASKLGGGKGTRGMYHHMVEMNRKRGTTLIQRYGARPAARIAAGHVLGRALTFFNVIGSLALGAELGRAVTQSIVDWTPSVAKPVELDFGTGFVEESFQARTMRQQSLAAIHNSQLTVRAALGNEAVHIHQ